jgi:hypothetical protein
MRTKTFLAALAASIVPSTALASFIDQDTGKTFVGILNVDTSSSIWQQRVTAGAGGLLVGIDVLPQRGTFNPPTESFLFFVNSGPPWQTGPHDFETVVTFDAQDTNQPWIYVDVRQAGIWLQPGDQFSWGASGLGDGAWLFQHHQLAYPGGELWRDGSIHTLSGRGSDMPFRTHMVIPEPTTLTVATFACVGVGIRRRRRWAAVHLRGTLCWRNEEGSVARRGIRAGLHAV